jgi:16S rRNA A1518/A1519 N6-dimethyltransferase RsmA/KsgA/DIM1 with predicted DNA glycosylase/AP lyase activity
MKIYHGDALTFQIGKHINKEAYGSPWESDELPRAFLLGNLPFNIATPLLFNILSDISDRNGLFACGRVPIIFLFQQEVGERMTCTTGFSERSRISVMSQTYCEVKMNFIIPGKYLILNRIFSNSKK